MNSKYLRKENEEDLDYAMRLIDIKKEERPDDLDWGDIVELLGLDLNKDSLRKSQDTEFGGLAVYNKMKKRIIEKEPIDYQKEVEVQLQEIKKERMKLNDERTALNRRLRSQSRFETIKEIAVECAKEDTKAITVNLPENEGEKDRAAILTLSDLHYGLEINEFNNVYNTDVFVNRFKKLLDKVSEYIISNRVSTLYVLGLGDYVSGIIHNSVRIENRENIVKQIVHISDYIGQALNILSKLCEIYYYDVNGNHERIFANKDDCQNGENFALFVRWYLAAKMEKNEKVHIMNNELNNEIGTVEIFGRNYAFTHGHRDKIDQVVQNLSLMTHRFYDAIFLGHTHHFEANEIHKTYIYVNGTLSGTDEYANNSRKTSNPSQNLFILNKDEGIECQYIIKL